AHPHAFIEMQSKPLIEQNQLIGFSMKWTLDEPSSSAILYDMKQVRSEVEQQKLIDDVMNNVVNEHYFSYFFDKNNNKIKYKKQIQNYGVNKKEAKVQYYFDFLLAQPQRLKNNEFTLMTYDRTYYVSMYYPEEKSAVDFSALPENCKGEIIEPNVDEKIRFYASSLDKTRKDEDDSLGMLFAQKIKIWCE
ncbi:zinc transporter binding subunit ZevA, partial [Rodentibacter caecimuris]